MADEAKALSNDGLRSRLRTFFRLQTLTRVVRGLLAGFVVLSAAWTFFCLFVLLGRGWLNVRTPAIDSAQVHPDVYPVLAPSLVYRELPGITRSLAILFSATEDSEHLSNSPIRVAVVSHRDSTCFVELTFLSQCACPADKSDRFEIIREIIDPLTGTELGQFRGKSLSAERVTEYFNPLTRHRRM